MLLAGFWALLLSGVLLLPLAQGQLRGLAEGQAYSCNLVRFIMGMVLILGILC